MSHSPRRIPIHKIISYRPLQNGSAVRVKRFAGFAQIDIYTTEPFDSITHKILTAPKADEIAARPVSV